ncbi:MAG TPA: hypothetical protein VGZ32_21505 [Actinocrinis sp.]|jgi:hypothetical protein|uniref:hypothetical protein n=1 Tax=Actinocrinis sp. TaxID=1920516 RepID=UPI002DDC9EA1|nr:hypothetical protein [Actinocrinis sp.]HEV3172937.1 hypothetical protein [Actinocrinis sp.]
MFSSSLLNFLSGLFAGVGLNLITQVQTGPLTHPAWTVVLDSLSWILASGFQAWAGHVVQSAEHEAELKIIAGLIQEERRAITLGEKRKVSTLYNRWGRVACASPRRCCSRRAWSPPEDSAGFGADRLAVTRLSEFGRVQV